MVGIDLGGASSNTTGVAVLAGRDHPCLVFAGQAALGKTPITSEITLRRLIADWAPTSVAIDAPLTLPPCLTCSPSCRGPGEECEIEAARLLWRSGWNATSQRACEWIVHDQVGERPLPTMQLGAIAARAIVLARHLRANGVEVVEVYPRATLRRLSEIDIEAEPRRLGELPDAFRTRVLAGLAGSVEHIDLHPILAADPHVFDALIGAYTAWLGPSGLEPPPPGFDMSSGWIWYPHGATRRKP